MQHPKTWIETQILIFSSGTVSSFNENLWNFLADFIAHHVKKKKKSLEK